MYKFYQKLFGSNDILDKNSIIEKQNVNDIRDKNNIFEPNDETLFIVLNKYSRCVLGVYDNMPIITEKFGNDGIILKTQINKDLIQHTSFTSNKSFFNIPKYKYTSHGYYTRDDKCNKDLKNGDYLLALDV